MREALGYSFWKKNKQLQAVGIQNQKCNFSLQGCLVLLNTSIFVLALPAA